MQAMILAAGFGTRLLPYTTSRPKPLFPILNQPLLLLTIKRLQRFGCDPIVVNCHHLAHQIVEAVSGLEGVIVQKEKTILGTGGGLRYAVRSFRNEPVLITNGDIYHTVNFKSLYQFHLQSKCEVSMAMHDEPRFNCVQVEADQVIDFSPKGSSNQLAFTGLHVVNRELLTEIPSQCFYSIIDLYRQIVSRGQTIAVTRVDNHYWTDMGTVADYLSLHEGLLKEKIRCWREFGKVNKPYLVSKDAQIRDDLCMQDWVSVGSAQIGDGVVLERSVVWDGVTIADNSRCSDTIISP